MRFVVTPLRRQGRALARRELGGDAVRGDVTLQHRGECPELGRAAIVAMVRGDGTPTTAPDALPRLYDAEIRTMGTNGLTISGLEFVNGVAYAQSWHCLAQ